MKFSVHAKILSRLLKTQISQRSLRQKLASNVHATDNHTTTNAHLSMFREKLFTILHHLIDREIKLTSHFPIANSSFHNRPFSISITHFSNKLFKVFSLKSPINSSSTVKLINIRIRSSSINLSTDHEYLTKAPIERYPSHQIQFTDK